MAAAPSEWPLGNLRRRVMSAPAALNDDLDSLSASPPSSLHFARSKPFPPVAEPVSEKVKASARGGNVADKDQPLKSSEAEDYEQGLLQELIEELEKKIGLGKKQLPTDRELVFTMAREAWTMAKTHYQGPRKSSNTSNAAGASSSSSSPTPSSSSSLPSSSSPSPFSVKSATGRLVLKYGSFGRFSSEMKHETGT